MKGYAGTGGKMLNNFKIETIIKFLEAIKDDPSLCLHDIYYRTGITMNTMSSLRNVLYHASFIEKDHVDLRRTNIKITLKGECLLNELRSLQ